MGQRDDQPTGGGSAADSPAFDATVPADRTLTVDDRTPPPAASAGTTLGRYLLGEAIGSGGMGVVYQARDPDLDRALAIKLVLPPLAGRRSHQRLLAEARAMAKLRHPAVVPVFDVGVTARGVHVVMPLLSGGTLHDWLSAAPRPWREVVDRFVTAGRGLAAAHAAGIVHRDFKPRNVLLDEHGAVMVADFGLADAAAPAASGDAQASSVVGTPAYMAPEQAAGAVVDARADQYSFCVSLWEGLHGRRPTAADGALAGRDAPPTATTAAAADGDRPPPPPWLQQAVARGLAVDPDQRWPSMAALLDHVEGRLRDDASTSPRARRRGVALGLAAVVLGGGALVAARAGRGPRARPPTVPATVPPDPLAAIAVAAPVQRTHTGGCVYAPTFLDDATLGFDLTLPGVAPDVYTYQVARDELRQVTAASSDEWRVSRGRTTGELAYLITGLPGQPSSVAVRDRATGVERTLAAGSAVAVTATADAYYYLRADGQEVRRVRGTLDEQIVALKRVARAQAMTAARDGRTLAIVGVVADASSGVCLIDVETRTETCPAHPEYLGPSRVDYGVRDDLYLASADGIRAYPPSGAARLIVPGARAYGGVAVSPDGKTLAYSDCTARGAITELGATPSELVAPDLGVAYLTAGPGGRVAWVRKRNQLFVRAADGAVRDLLGPGRPGDGIAFPAFDASGRQLAFGRIGKASGIWVVDTDHAAPPSQITFGDHDFQPVFLNDGSLVFAREVDGNLRLFHVVPGAEPTQVLPRPRQVIDIDRATGRVLLRSDDQQFLYWWDPRTGKERPGPPTFAPGTDTTTTVSLSPDGAWMLYQAGPLGQEVWRTPTARWRPERVFTASPGATLDRADITDAGHPLITERVWRGELFTVAVTRGAL